MSITRRQMLLAAPCLFFSSGVWAQVLPPGTVSVYLVPMNDFPEDLAEFLAKSLRDVLGLPIKSASPLPPLQVDVLPGTTQLMAEGILALGSEASARLPEASPTTYRIFLTIKDINSQSENARFVVSSHSKALNCSVVSLARMVEISNERPALTERALLRLVKMTTRSIGEMYLGWTRSPNPDDLMFSPLTSVDELDRMNLQHEEQPAKKEQEPGLQETSGKTIFI